jgi:uncharacterized protein (TIGR00295 family)
MAAAVPSPDDCRALRARLGVPASVADHCDAVAGLALALARRLAAQGHLVDAALIEAGALLHDVGRARTHGLDHAAVGADLLRAEGLPEAVCLIVERHTGAGVDAKDAAAAGLPPRNYTPHTLEEKVVCHADNLVDGSRRQKVHEELAHLSGRGLDHVAEKMLHLHRELSALAGQDLDELG